MKKLIYERNYERLEAFLGGNLKEVFEKYSYIKLKANGFMDLNIDILDNSKLAMAHNYEQNGDLVPDPDMEIEVNFEMKMIETLSMQNIYGYLEVYTFDEGGKKKGVYPERKKELNEFLETWLKNLKSQGHKITEMEGK